MSNIENTSTASDCLPLLELATPHIYRGNLFRMLGLPVNATAREVQRQQAKRKMEEKLGVASNGAAQGPLSLDPAPSELETRTAMERLNRPIDRMLDEVFWFWPLAQTGEDAALKLLQSGDAGGARKLWREDERNGLAAHNLAVLDHLAALDLEVRGLTTPLNAREQERLATLWKAIFPRWKQVFEGEEFPASLKARVRELNDDQLSTGFARRLCTSLPFALLLINAKLACAAAERGDKVNAQRHLALIEAAKFADGLGQQVIKAALQRIRERIKTTADSARGRWKKAGQRGGQFVRELAEQGRKLLDIVDILLPESDPARVAMHDIIVEAMMEGQVAYGKKTDDWGGSIKLLELALTLHPSEAMKARVLENVEILKENAKSGGDWVSAGYWDLPEETVEQLEAAREKSRAFDHDGALSILVGVDTKHGAPLKRCVAYALRGKSIQIFNKGIGLYNEQTPYRQAFFDKLIAMDRGALTSLLMRAPNPHVSAYLNPDCINCGNSGYTSWYNFTLRNVPLWWCPVCQNKHVSQIEEQKQEFRPALTSALEYILLAQEITPKKEASITDDVTHFKKMAGELGASVPDTKALRKRLSSSSMRGTLKIVDAASDDGVCAFCDERASDSARQITVPMCGDVRSIEMMFGTGIEYQHTNVVVPRCRGCCAEHREFPARLSQWNQSRTAAMSDEHFPLQAAAARSAAQAAERAAQELAAAKRLAQQIVDELAAAEAIGTVCEGCKSAKGWKNCVCATCDLAAYKMSEGAALGLGVFWIATLIQIIALFVDDVKYRGVLENFGRVIAILITAWLGLLVYKSQTKKRIDLGKQREAEFASRRAAAVLAAEAKGPAATLAIGNAFSASQLADARKTETAEALRLSKEKAAKAFESTFQKPTLRAGVHPQEVFIHYLPIKELLKQGWAFGSTLDSQTHRGAAEPVNVVGLVESPTKM